MKKRERTKKQQSIVIQFSEHGGKGGVPAQFPLERKQETTQQGMPSTNDPNFVGFEESGLDEKQYQAYRRLNGQRSIRESLTRMYLNAKSHFSFASTTRQSENVSVYKSGLGPMPATPAPQLPMQNTMVQDDVLSWPIPARVADSRISYARAS